MLMVNKEEVPWLKSKGYLHITPQLDIIKHRAELVGKITNVDFVSRYAFFPLIHTNIVERRYKRSKVEPFKRCHSYIKDGCVERNSKCRPLHYATHFDSMVYSYYASVLQEKYEEKIEEIPGLYPCIIAYRRLPSDRKGKHKSTIHFAKEIFEEIRTRASTKGSCSVLTFDIKSFFSSLDHDQLKKLWCFVLDSTRLRDDHYNVFKAATQFSYIYLDELRIGERRNGKREGFNERKLASIRNRHGVNAFFESPRAFREGVKDGTVKVHKYPFRDKNTGKPIGIPQGLPISAVLANLYLLDFDKAVLDKVVNGLGGYYRRYCDDIVVICAEERAKEVEAFILNAILASKVEISPDKTERFLFKEICFGSKGARLASIKLTEKGAAFGSPLNYLGFEFNGHNILIKSTNIAKFYRRMITSIKHKCKRAIKEADKRPGEKPRVFRRQLYRLYTTRPLSNVKLRKRWKTLKEIYTGEYRLQTKETKVDLRSNYITYVKRASKTMGEPAILKQIKKRKRIFNQAIFRNLRKKKD